MKQTALVICPGRGTYNKKELGYLRKHHGERADLITMIDAYRKRRGETSISELDAQESYNVQDHTRGDNASSLIYACAYADFLSINREKFDIVAITGNSMGWYIALACGGAVSAQSGVEIIDEMGAAMQKSMIGGQIIYPLVDENWQEIPGRRAELLKHIAEIEDLYLSIELGGMLVLAGSNKALKRLSERLEPEQGRFPLRLPNHAAFHTELMEAIAARARETLGPDLFAKPACPLVDGRGHIWSCFSSSPQEMWRYTLEHQICETYNFTRGVQVAAKEFAPDRIIILGPGNTLGSVVAQSLLEIGWQGMKTKDDFIARQKADPYILSMGLDDQRALAV